MQHSAEFLAVVDEARPRVRELSIADLNQERGYLLVDVREDHEWSEGHIAGALHLSRGILERDAIGRLPDKHAAIVLYCGGGYRSILAADSLQKMGYTNVRSLIGGWKAAVAAGLPIDR